MSELKLTLETARTQIAQPEHRQENTVRQTGTDRQRLSVI